MSECEILGSVDFSRPLYLNYHVARKLCIRKPFGVLGSLICHPASCSKSFKKKSECRSKREMPSLYPHAKGILYALKDKGIDVAIASRSPTSDIAKTFLDKLGIQPMFVAKEIFSSWTHKTEHLQRIHRRTGIPFKSMLFFDDEDRNIEAVSKMGVTSILVDDGVNLEELRSGLRNYTSNSASSNTKQSD